MAPGSAVKPAVRGCLEGKAVRVGTHAKELAVSVNAGCVQRDSLKECLVRDTASRDMMEQNLPAASGGGDVSGKEIGQVARCERAV